MTKAGASSIISRGIPVGLTKGLTLVAKTAFYAKLDT